MFFFFFFTKMSIIWWKNSLLKLVSIVYLEKMAA